MNTHFQFFVSTLFRRFQSRPFQVERDYFKRNGDMILLCNIHERRQQHIKITERNKMKDTAVCLKYIKTDDVIWNVYKD